jgi:hypothetical protein
LVAVPAAVAALQVLPYVGEAVAGTVIGQEAMGHRVLAPAYGTRYKLPAVTPAGSGGDLVVNRHLMDWVVSGIEARQKQLQSQ